MSFITKRERIFNEYDLYELPSRNEGKLKAYSSCTDTRAWSHFGSDKSEHLTDIIKRNNETCRPKYVPTEAIVNTLLATKHAEIARLKRKIEEFERMLAAYDELELTCDQKCEIAKAHTAIKEANKDLNELWFDLDLSGFTGIDSEDYETGKSRGDEPSRFRDQDGNETPRSKGEETSRSKGDEPSYSQQWSFEKEPPQRETKGSQAGPYSGHVDCACDASTNVVDPRIEQMRDSIISKDAKLNAMKNTMAVMENDVCEPYCIYAHIYTALEKILRILCQNTKYKMYLDLMSAGKDTRCVDIKGKILFKLKVLEKFSLALIAPCSQDFASTTSKDNECSCYHAEIETHIETTFALTTAEARDTSLDSKRAQLIADIMEHDEMKEILSKESASLKADLNIDVDIDSYNIDQENAKRLKNLQENYDDLMTCFEALKHEKDCLQIRCQKYADLEKEFEILQSQLREYNALWNEKEHYRKRSTDLDSLKEQYMVLCDETTNLETELKAETEINRVKTKIIDELRNDNMVLEKRLNEACVAFEKEKNCAQCKLKESECTIMCQGQQIKSLSIQIDRLLEQDPEKLQSKRSETPSIALIDEMNSLKEQVKNLQDALYCNEEEKQQLQEEYQNMLNLLNNLKIEVEDWKSNYEKTLQRNDYLEKYTAGFRDEVHKLIEENRTLSQSVEEKSNAIDNLIDVIKNKSQEVNNLMNDVEHKNKENSDLCDEIHSLHDAYNKSITASNTENSQTAKSLKLAQQESQELLKKVRDYDDIIHKQEDFTHLYQEQTEEFERLKTLLIITQKEKENLQMDLTSHENNNSMLLREIKKLQDVNNNAVNDVSSLKDDKERYKASLELTKKDSKILADKVLRFEDLSNQLQQLKESHQQLIQEKCRLENELANKTFELDSTIHEFLLTKKKESQELEDKLENTEYMKQEFKNVDEAYKKLIKEQQRLQLELNEKKKDFDSLLESFNNLKNKLEQINGQTSEQVKALSKELTHLKKTYNELLVEQNDLKKDYGDKAEEIKRLHCTLENKIDENRELSKQLRLLEMDQQSVQSEIYHLQKEHCTTKNSLNVLKKESDELLDRVKHYEILQSEYEELQKDHDRVKKEKNRLQEELDMQIAEKNRIEKDNQALNNESKNLFLHNEDLEKALISARNELMVSSSNPSISQIEIIREIEEMKSEKISNHHRIRDLLDNLDESECIISDLREDILARDDKISILENHINGLQDEVQRLHSSLAEIVDTGEQIKDNSYQRIRESMNAMEAHHSKATHNMKIEVAKLQNDNITLEKRLSTNKIKFEDSARDKHKYVSQVIHLQNEREIIVTDIKQLEMNSVGDSILSPDNCDVEDILNSLDRIRRHVDARCSRNTSLEQTLLKVQHSYQVVQSKADEAKKIVENEKQKILNEKEEAIRDKISMGNQLTELKEQLKKQVAHDKNIIKDLEAEILNQKLLFDNLNKTTQSYISKLREEMQSLKDLYQKSIENVSELENRLQLMSEEKKSDLYMIENIKIKLDEKSNEIEMLKKDLDILKNKPSHSLGTQALVSENRDEETQTNIELNYEGINKTDGTENIKQLDDTCDFITIHTKKPVLERKVIENDTLKHVNEVQVLTANIDSTFDCIRSSYLNKKLKQLSLGRLEYYSISCTSENDTELEDKVITIPDIKKSNEVPITDQSSENVNVIDIYNKHSMHTNSSKVIIDLDNERDLKSPGKSGITDFGLTNESLDTKSSMHKASNLFGSVSGVSTDKDLFVIYRDSESNYVDKSYDKKSWPMNARSEIFVEAVTNQSVKNNQNKLKTNHNSHREKQNDTETDPFFYLDDDELNEDDSAKHKLNISLPRVHNDSTVMDTASDDIKKSQESYTMYSAPKSTYSLSDHKMDNIIKIKGDALKAPSTHSLSNDETLYLNSYSSTEDENVHPTTKKPRSGKVSKNKPAIPLETMHGNTNPGSSFVKTRIDKDSHHKLSRIDADIRLIKTKANKLAVTENKVMKSKPENFALDYILATARMDPENVKIYNATEYIRKARSNELLDNSIKLHGRSDSSPSRISDEKKSSTDYKTVSSNNQYSLMSQSKTYTERSVMVKLADPNEEYERKIKQLTNNLENIEKDYKKKIEAIKMQYDSNVKSILNEHNEGVKNIQGLHEETLRDIIKHHENEVENLRSMSIDAMRKSDKLEKEVRSLKCKMCSSSCLEVEPIKMSSPESRYRKSRVDTKTLTKTNVEAFNVKPKNRSHGPCTCSLDINVSDTIRNMFEQVDAEQKKMAEHTYLKYIANKVVSSNVEALDCQELSVLHLAVCRIWKVKLTKEESLQKRIDSLEAELMTRQRHTQNNMAELDRKVAEEKRRLQEVREAVCRNVPTVSRYETPDIEASYVPSASTATVDKGFLCNCDTSTRSTIGERLSAGDLPPAGASGRTKRVRPDTNRAVLAKLDAEDRREKKIYHDEPPTRLRRPHERQSIRFNKKF